jgi:outer membrane protein assembly factor BamB
MTISFIFFLAASMALRADDWPQWLGPKRDGTSQETKLAKTWPAKGPPIVWETAVGEGFSGPVIAEGRLILFHREGDKDLIECLDASTGKRLWKFVYTADYVDGMNMGDGPRATPAIVDGRVYTLGAQGWLRCLDFASGDKIWSRNLNADYQPPASYFGVGSSPLVEGNHVLVNVGAKNAGIVAFHKDTGKEVWKATDDGASYSSPVAAEIGGTRQAVFFTRQGVVVLDPATGKVGYSKRWRSRMEASVNGATPLVVNDLLFFSACYDTGALLLRAAKTGFEEVWSGEEILSNHYCTSLHFQGYLYGIDGRQEGGARLRCVELRTGKVQWTKEGFGCASMALAEGHVIAVTERGDLVSIELSPQEYREKARAAVFENLPVRAQIALADGKLYARDGKRLVCWNVRQP